ncbi:MAG: DNA-3-methyladenine glycosylase [Spiroplasma sp.]
MIEKINQDFFLSDAVTLAKKLLGKILVRNINGQTIKARIVETEAYMGAIDKASHSYDFKKTKRTLPMYQIGGTTYIYLIYGMYYCFNIIASTENDPQAVLIRAVEIIEGQDVAKKYIATNNHNKSLKYWTNGPSKVSLALNINQSLNNLHLLNNNLLTLVSDDFCVEASNIIATKRINIDYAEEDKDHFWRFYLKNSCFVSKIV